MLCLICVTCFGALSRVVTSMYAIDLGCDLLSASGLGYDCIVWTPKLGILVKPFEYQNISVKLISQEQIFEHFKAILFESYLTVLIKLIHLVIRF